MVSAALLCTQAAAQPTLDQLDKERAFIEQAQAINKAVADLDALDAMVKNIEIQRQHDCMRAFGSEHFCSCINKDLPVGLDFHGYINVTTLTKEQLGYAKLSADSKKMVDLVAPIRDRCVAAKP